MAEKNSPEHWEPPKEGELKINCAGRLVRGRGGFSAVARNSSGDLVAVAYGSKSCSRALEIQLHSILTALQLAKRLKDEGKHDGPVTVETHHELAQAMMMGSDTRGLKEEDDDDDDDDGTVVGCLAAGFGVAGRDWSIVLMEKEEMAKKLPKRFKDLIETEKQRAGLAASKAGGDSQGGSC